MPCKNYYYFPSMVGACLAVENQTRKNDFAEQMAARSLGQQVLQIPQPVNSMYHVAAAAQAAAMAQLQRSRDPNVP